MSTLTIELSDDLAARLAAASAQAQVAPSLLVQEALERTLPMADGSLAEKMKGLIGCFDSGVDDLATNPKHMEGFGQWRR